MREIPSRSPSNFSPIERDFKLITVRVLAAYFISLLASYVCFELSSVYIPLSRPDRNKIFIIILILVNFSFTSTTTV